MFIKIITLLVILAAPAAARAQRVPDFQNYTYEIGNRKITLQDGQGEAWQHQLNSATIQRNDQNGKPILSVIRPHKIHKQFRLKRQQGFKIDEQQFQMVEIIETIDRDFHKHHLFIFKIESETDVISMIEISAPELKYKLVHFESEPPIVYIITQQPDQYFTAIRYKVYKFNGINGRFEILLNKLLKDYKPIGCTK